jgi:hypothetical protein
MRRGGPPFIGGEREGLDPHMEGAQTDPKPPYLAFILPPYH